MRSLLVPILLPMACAWVAEQERRILAEGTSLNAAQLADARAIGISHPERVRLLAVPVVPLPGGWLPRLAYRLANTLTDQTAGLSARYGIYIRSIYWGDRRLLAHELTHTLQYERLDGIRPFLRQYLHECLTMGYAGAPMELEASAMASRFQ